ncbi:MAG: hypothetical protein DI628_04600 [Blastochloris viridis]|uniref:Uncharacterized protein n=1 Tax=Blastochloris viridis TaxID=1079 RepID=A0A6N4RD27_BLAVI|nr:MAG: hypothetical protein DI628_04600 [Blastochloris viridis]
MTDINQNLPADTSRFARPHPSEKVEVISSHAAPMDMSEIRPSLQAATEGLHTSSWIKATGTATRPKRKSGNQRIPG